MTRISTSGTCTVGNFGAFAMTPSSASRRTNGRNRSSTFFWAFGESRPPFRLFSRSPSQSAHSRMLAVVMSWTDRPNHQLEVAAGAGVAGQLPDAVRAPAPLLDRALEVAHVGREPGLDQVLRRRAAAKSVEDQLEGLAAQDGGADLAEHGLGVGPVLERAGPTGHGAAVGVDPDAPALGPSEVEPPAEPPADSFLKYSAYLAHVSP